MGVFSTVPAVCAVDGEAGGGVPPGAASWCRSWAQDSGVALMASSATGRERTAGNVAAVGVLDEPVGLAARAVKARLQLGTLVDVVLELGQLGAERLVIAGSEDRPQLVLVDLAQLVGGPLD